MFDNHSRKAILLFLGSCCKSSFLVFIVPKNLIIASDCLHNSSSFGYLSFLILDNLFLEDLCLILFFLFFDVCFCILLGVLDDDDFNTVCDEDAQLPAPEYTYSVRNTSDDNEVALLRCDEKMSTSSESSISSEEDYQKNDDDYKMMDKETFYNIRYTDDINKLKNFNNQDESILYDERIQYSIDLNKK